MVVKHWCILRMSGGSTLPVASALAEAGFSVWTPTLEQRRRIGRERLVKEVVVPITPGIVFADEGDLHELSMLARSPAMTYRRWNPEVKRMEIRGCPSFSVFRHGGRYPRVADHSLDPLRQAEQRSRPKDKAVTFEVGEQVRIPETAFGGLIGIVEKQKRKTAIIRVQAATGNMLIEVEMSDLLSLKAAA